MCTWQEGACEKHPLNAYSWCNLAHKEDTEKSLPIISFEKNSGPVQLEESYNSNWKLYYPIERVIERLLTIWLLICVCETVSPLPLLSVSKLLDACCWLVTPLNFISETPKWCSLNVFVFLAIETVHYNNRTCSCQENKTKKPHQQNTPIPPPPQHTTVRAPFLNYNLTRLLNFSFSIQVSSEKYNVYVSTVL